MVVDLSAFKAGEAAETAETADAAALFELAVSARVLSRMCNFGDIIPSLGGSRSRIVVSRLELRLRDFCREARPVRQMCVGCHGSLSIRLETGGWRLYVGCRL
jgi:hypothetical protein